MQNLLHTATTASLEAGKAILEIYAGRDFGVELKEDDTPLTLADRKAHQIIGEHLEKTGIPLLSEEGKDIPYEERKHYDCFWLVDPLDGTREFIKRNGEFTVNIALIKGQDPVLGVVYVPVEDLLYVGVVGEDVSGEDVFGDGSEDVSEEDVSGEGSGEDSAHMQGVPGRGDTCAKGHKTSWARKVHNASLHSFDDEGANWPGELLPLTGNVDSVVSEAPEEPGSVYQNTYRVVASRSHITKETEKFIRQIKKQQKNVQLVSKGSSLKICLVAEGTADVYPRFGPTFEWDTAAGHAIALASGASVMAVKEGLVDLAETEDMNTPHHDTLYPLKYNKENIRNPWFVIKR